MQQPPLQQQPQQAMSSVALKWIGQGSMVWYLISLFVGGDTSSIRQTLHAMWMQAHAFSEAFQRWWLVVMWPLLCAVLPIEWQTSMSSAHAWCIHAAARALGIAETDIQGVHMTMVLLTVVWFVALFWLWMLRRVTRALCASHSHSAKEKKSESSQLSPQPDGQLVTPQDLVQVTLESPSESISTKKMATVTQVQEEVTTTTTVVSVTPAVTRPIQFRMTPIHRVLQPTSLRQLAASQREQPSSVMVASEQVSLITSSDDNIAKNASSPFIDAAIPEHPQKSIWLCDSETMTCRREAVIPMPRTTDTPISALTHDGANSVLDHERFHLELINPDRKSSVVKDEAFASRIAAYHPTFSRTDWSPFQEWYRDRNIVFGATIPTQTASLSSLMGSLQQQEPQYEIYPRIVDFDQLNDPMRKINQPLEWRRDMERVTTLPSVMASPSSSLSVHTSRPQQPQTHAIATATSSSPSSVVAAAVDRAILPSGMNMLVEIGRFIGDKCYEMPETLDLKREMANIRIPFGGTVTYEEFVRQSASFDLFAVRGHGSLSNLIHAVQNHARDSSLYTHVGQVLDHTLIWPGGHGAPPNAKMQKFTIESVISGDMIDGFDTTTDIHGRSVNGVQIRETYRQMVVKENEHSIFFWGKLKPEYRAKVDALLKRQYAASSINPIGEPVIATTSEKTSTSSRDPIVNIHMEIGKLLGTPYPNNPYNFLYGLFDHFGDDPYFADQEMSIAEAIAALDAVGNGQSQAFAKSDASSQPQEDGHTLRAHIKSKMSNAGEHIFCSELVVRLLVQVGILPPIYSRYARQFYPIDLVGESHLPALYEAIYIIQHPQLK